MACILVAAVDCRVVGKLFLPLLMCGDYRRAVLSAGTWRWIPTQSEPVRFVLIIFLFPILVIAVFYAALATTFAVFLF